MRGYVYLVTAPHINAVKIGHWIKTLQRLRKRYTTAYGLDLTIQARYVANCAHVEDWIHQSFKACCLGGELFDKKHIADYAAALLTEPTVHTDFSDQLKTYHAKVWVAAPEDGKEEVFLAVPVAKMERPDKERREFGAHPPRLLILRTASDVQQLPNIYSGLY